MRIHGSLGADVVLSRKVVPAGKKAVDYLAFLLAGGPPLGRGCKVPFCVSV